MAIQMLIADANAYQLDHKEMHACVLCGEKLGKIVKLLSKCFAAFSESFSLI